MLWVGMWLVLKGPYTKSVDAFRIISGNVTGPLLQLAGLYQGLQSVQLSMERLVVLLINNLNPILPLKLLKSHFRLSKEKLHSTALISDSVVLELTKLMI